MGLKICGTGSAFPDKIVTNDMLAQKVDTSDEWISSRTGIKERRIAVEATTLSLASEAAKHALEDAGIAPEEIDLVLVATFTPDSQMPSISCGVQAACGCVNATAFDLNAACSGFLFALNTASAYFEAGIYKKALIIGAETLSKVIDWNDRGTCVLFGDGAGAVVAAYDKDNKMAFIQGADGRQASVLTCHPFISMEGQEVFKFAVRKVPECVNILLEKTDTDINEIDYFLLHQANKRILESVAKRLKQPEEKFPMNLDRFGNTSAASIPILLDEVNKKGMLKKGHKLIFSGFGAGLTWGAAMLTW